MAKRSKNEELDTILQAMRFHPEVALEEISKLIGGVLPRRTLQRRLATLVTRGELKRQGDGRGAVYIYAIDKYRSPISATRISRIEEPITPYGIPYSPEAKEILQYVTQTPQERKKIGYQRELLDAYKPNITFYLPQEMRMKLHHLGTPYGESRPAGSYVREIFNRLIIDLAWNSSRLEGNSYSLLETERLITSGEPTAGKDDLETRMIINHQLAIAYLVDYANEIDFNKFTVLNLHGLLSDRLLKNPSASGRLRNIAVYIGHCQYTPTSVPQLIDECFTLILDKAAKIQDPFEQAFFAMVHLPYLQPFEDVNKRTSRLAANIPLIKNNLCPLSFIDVSENAYVNAILAVYEMNRIELLRDVFAWAYERSAMNYQNITKTLPAVDPFDLKYHEQKRMLGYSIIKEAMSKPEAAIFIHKWVKLNIPFDDQLRFTEILENDLLTLHEGICVRFRVGLAEFQRWQERWLGK